MCVEWTDEKWSVTKETIIAYKVFRREGSRRRRSLWNPHQRVPQGLRLTWSGRLLSYALRRTTEARPPGVYLFETVESALRCAKREPFAGVLEVRIPAGARIRRGSSLAANDTINATACYPLRELPLE